MKKIIVVSTYSCTTLVALIIVFMLTGSTKKDVTANPLSDAMQNISVTDENTSNDIVIQPHEMPASQLKEVLLAELNADTTTSSKEPFFLEHHACSPKLLACLLMATKDHAAARKLLENKSKLMLEQLQALRDHEATRDVMAELEILEGQKMSNAALKLVEIVTGLDVLPATSFKIQSI